MAKWARALLTQKQRGYAMIIAFVLIIALALVSLFALQQARRDFLLARVSAESLQVEQVCLSLSNSLMRHFTSLSIINKWAQNTGDWCLNNNSQLVRNCPTNFENISNSANITISNTGQLQINSSASGWGLGCAEKIEIELDSSNNPIITMRLRTYD